MHQLFSRKFKFVFFIFLVGFFSFGFLGNANADYTPKIYVSGLQIISNGSNNNTIKSPLQIINNSSNQTQAGNNQIKGQFTVFNAENYYFPELNYVIKLFKGTNFNTLELIDAQVPSAISVSPNGKVAESFTYTYPQNIVSGDYTLRVQIVTAQGSELGWDDQVVSLKGQNNFLNILGDSSKVVVGSDSSLPLQGVNVSSEANVTAFLKVKNSGDAKTVTPHIKIFKRQYNMDLIKEYDDSSIIFGKGETKNISLAMPQLNTPESYLAEVKFYNNNQQVSGIQYFRWVVQGASGKILYITTDKDSYKAGENMNVTIYSVGPADLSTISGAGLDITVYNQNKNVVYTTSKNIELNMGLLSTTITVPIKADLFHPIISGQITDKGKVLDQLKTILPVASTQAKQLQKKAQNITLILYLIFGLIFLLVVIFLIVKRKSVYKFLKSRKLIK